MGSQWHYRWKGQEKGPVSFQNLAQLIRSGDLSEDDFVRRVHSTAWVRARDVIGLLHAAGMDADETETEAESQPSTQPSTQPPTQPPTQLPAASPQTGTKTMSLRRIGRREILIGSVVTVTILLVGSIIWRHYAHPRFPRRPGAARATPENPRSKVLAAAAAARSKSLSVPGLAPGVPQRVPGLEKMNPTSSFSLSEDLCTIVFAAPGPYTKSSDLWIAKRADVAKPFAQATLIASCNSARFEAKPNISPDGLDMLFMRAQDGPKWFHAKRLSPSQDFGQPEPWILSGLPKTAGEIAHTRFLDALHILVSVNNLDSKPPFSFYLVERPDTNHPFGEPQEILMDGCGARACVRPKRLLAYFGTEKGLFVQGRDSLDERFGRGHCIIDPEVCGPIQEAIWVAPGDDVAFYCSLGPGKSPGPAKQPTAKKNIWMIRF